MNKYPYACILMAVCSSMAWADISFDTYTPSPSPMAMTAQTIGQVTGDLGALGLTGPSDFGQRVPWHMALATVLPGWTVTNKLTTQPMTVVSWRENTPVLSILQAIANELPAVIHVSGSRHEIIISDLPAPTPQP